MSDTSATGSVIGSQRQRASAPRRQTKMLGELQQTDLLLAVLDGMKIPVYVKDDVGRYLLVNPAAAQVFQIKPPTLVGKLDAELGYRFLSLETCDEDQQIIQNQVSLTHELEMVVAGQRRYFLHQRYPLHQIGDNRNGLVGVLQDITAMVQARREREAAVQALHASADRLRNIVEGLTEGLVITDTDDVILFTNRRMAELIGYSRQELTGRSAADVFLPASEWERLRQRNQLATDARPEQHEILIKGANGRQFWAQINTAPFRESDGRIIGTLGAISDITERREAEEQLRWQATHDALTKLPNRTLFYDRLDNAILTARRNNTTVALFFFDLNRFKEVNDVLGHEAGDRVLIELTERLQQALPDDAMLARLSGDEFTVILPDASPLPDRPVALALEMLDVLRAPFCFEAQEVALSMSLGIAVFPYDGANRQELLQAADMAMYRAKEEGAWNPQGTYQLYTPRMNEKALERLFLLNDLRRAVEAGEFSLNFQPILNAATGKMAAVEALLRWQHPQAGMISPDKFIRLAEETGLVVPLGKWVLTTVCQQLRAWRDAGVTLFPVAVNLSARQFREPNLALTILHELNAAGISPTYLHVELTETVLMEQDQTGPTLDILRGAGVRVALDDFGIGYSSLAYLRRLPVDILKIDRAFIRDLSESPTDRAIVQAVVELAHALNMEVVAEGVESMAQIQCLREMSCDCLQGYRISTPVPAHLLPLHGNVILPTDRLAP